MTTFQTDIIAKLEQHIVDECTPFDAETGFAEYLDNEGAVNVAGMEFMPSDVWRNCYPTAFRCGCNDYVDGEQKADNLTGEIHGDVYCMSDADSAKEEFLDTLRDELAELEADEDEVRDGDAVNSKQAEIDAVEAHSF